MDTPVPAVVLAAGRGSRLEALTAHLPKPLVDLAGVRLLDRMLTSLAAVGAGPVTLVTGYRGRLMAQAAPGCAIVRNPHWAQTSIAASFLAAVDAGALDGGGLVVYGDIVVEPRVLAALLGAPPADVAVAVNTAWLALWSARMPDPLADAERLVLNGARLIDIGGAAVSVDQVPAQFMGLLRLTGAGAGELADFYRRAMAADHAARRWDTTALLRFWLAAGGQAAAVPVAGGWLEVDTPADRDLYEQLQGAGCLAELCDLSATDPHTERATR